MQELGHIQVWGSMRKTAGLTVKIAVNHSASVIVVVHGQHCTPCSTVICEHTEGANRTLSWLCTAHPAGQDIKAYQV